MLQDSVFSRRHALRTMGLGLAGLSLGSRLLAQDPGHRPPAVAGVRIVNPAARVPVSFIIDDSTCLVNLAHFGIPQFADVFPDRYKQDWRKLPREIPDSFVRKFGEWCRDHGVKGKYSIVPFPACVGWVDSEMPGWTHRQLEDSVRFVRDFMMVDWDIHPEMVSHTRVIDIKTGKPYPDRNENFMENWGWSVGKSPEQLAEYIAYALRSLKNAGLYCEGITTPGGFGNRSMESLAQGTEMALRDVFAAEIPHYFRNLYTDDRSVAPKVQYARNLDSNDPRCVVSVIGCTGDWFGGWDGLVPGHVDQFITEDLKGGRLPQVIDKGEPAILVCHWPGIYYNGEEIGFKIFQDVVDRLHRRYDNLIWMKNSEIARYWAAKELTRISLQDETIALEAPFATPRCTVEFSSTKQHEVVVLTTPHHRRALEEVKRKLELRSGTFHRENQTITACFDLPRGLSTLDMKPLI